MKRLIVLFIFLTLLGIATSPRAQAAQIVGQVLEANGGYGIQNLEVKLLPPSSSQQSVRLTTTDRNGNFTFAGLGGGRYVLEISQGVYLLYRNVVDTGATQPIVIRLGKRS